MFTVGDVQAAMPGHLAGRQVATQVSAEYIRKAVLELTESYPFAELEVPGPIVTLNQGQVQYAPSYFYPVEAPAEKTLINSISSIFLYTNPGQVPVPLGSNQSGTNAGYNLVYRTFSTIQIEINISSIPIHWSRYNNMIWISYSPNGIYYCYANFQQENPFPNAGTIDAPSDTILMPNSWQEIVEYASAYRAAKDLRIYDVAKDLYQAVWGDPKFQLTGGTQGSPGLIFKRTSQNEQDQTSAGAVKALKMYSQPYQKR